MLQSKDNIPTIFTAFGASGDLMRIKVVPALFHLYQSGELPTMFRVVGFSRRQWSDADFREHVRAIVSAHAVDQDQARIDSFLELFYFQRGDFDERQSYADLKERTNTFDREWGVCANKLFYLAVAPEFYTTIASHVAESGLSESCGPNEGWTRIVVEKPFGHDGESARVIDDTLAKLFREEQIYRVEHYLAKEMLQNILNFRFANNVFESQWDNTFIEKIEIRLLESIGVEKRGSFYDATGTLRDVGQNHFLQMLALLTMERPVSLDSAAIREKRAQLLEALEIPTPDEIKRFTTRAQYKGFREIAGVSPESTTETYFKVRASIQSARWMGVPITMEGGKRLGPARKEIQITFKHPRACLCPPEEPHHTNGVIIRMEPREEIVIEWWAKKPGHTAETEKRSFDFALRERPKAAQYTEEYEKLLLDCIRGDQTLFVSTPEVRAMWKFIDPIVSAWQANATPLLTYEPDTQDFVERNN